MMKLITRYCAQRMVPGDTEKDKGPSPLRCHGGPVDPSH